MDRHPNDITTDEEIDAAIARAAEFESFPRIVEAVFRPEKDLDFLMLRLNDGRRLFLPREELSELKNASLEQIFDFEVGRYGLQIWWPQIDDGIYLPNLLAEKAEKLAA